MIEKLIRSSGSSQLIKDAITCIGLTEGCISSALPANFDGYHLDFSGEQFGGNLIFN